MSEKNSSPADVREMAMDMRAAWSNIGEDAQYGEMTLAELEASIAALDTASRSIISLQDQLSVARSDYWTRRQALWDQLKRVKLGVRIRHGEESSEYERFGGTRPSQRRRPQRVAIRNAN